VELMFPVLQENLRKTVFEILSVYFRDNSNAWLLDAEGAWTRLEPAPGEETFRAQSNFLSRAAKLNTEEHPVRGDFIVRRSPPIK